MKTTIQYTLSTLALLLLIASSADAQTPQSGWDFVQSRYHQGSGACGSCQPTNDGVAQLRFKPGSVVLGNDGTSPTLSFTIQNRLSAHSGSPAIRIDATVSLVGYNTKAFGESLSTPPITTLGVFNNDNGSNGKCTVTRSAVFTTALTNYDTYNPSVSNTLPNVLGLEEKSKSFLTPALAGTVLPQPEALTREWLDFITITCRIANTNNEAGLAFSAAATDGYSIRRVGPPIAQRPIVPLPNDQYIGFRLDGKTYAKRYDRFSDGKGLLIEFSKGIKNALAEANLDTGGVAFASANSITHTAGSQYATIRFAAARQTLTNITIEGTAVMDADDDALADGNYVASLKHETRAPVATTITKLATCTPAPSANQNHSCWEITFDKALFEASVAEGFCVTEDSGFCPEVNPTAEGTLRIASAALKANTTGVVALRIDEGDGQVGGVRSIAVRRNELLTAGTFVPAEDYQVVLRNQLTLEDVKPPTVTVEAVMPDGEDPDGKAGKAGQALVTDEDDTNVTYNLKFEVTVNETVESFGVPAGYVLLRIPKTGAPVKLTNTPTVSVSADGLTATLVFTGVSITVAQAEETDGFAVGRGAGTALQDTSDKEPTSDGKTPIAVDAPISLARSAIARTAQPIACAAFVAGIGQQDLFLRLELDGTIDIAEDKFALLSSAGTTLTTSKPTDEGAAVEGGVNVPNTKVVKIVLKDPITSSDPITVFYQAAAERLEATCEADRTGDADGDGILDIRDANPFDSDEKGVNSTVSGELAAVPEPLAEFFSRSIVIPSVMMKDFSYISQETSAEAPKVVTLQTLTVQQYFGIPNNAKVYADRAGTTSCADALDYVEANMLSKSSGFIGSNCIDLSNPNGLLAQPAATPIKYYWAATDGDGNLTSQSRNSTMTVYALVNFDGQNTYFLNKATDTAGTTLNISAYAAADTTNDLEYRVHHFVGEAGGVSADANLENDNDGLLTGTYSTAANRPAAGMAGYYWLGQSASGAGMWVPPEDGVAAKEGGVITTPLSKPYAMGPNNFVYIATRAADDPEAFELTAAELADADGSLVKTVSRTAGTQYEFIVGFKELAEAPKVSVLSALLGGHYEVREVSGEPVILSETDGAGFEFIITAGAASTEVRVIQVGMKIGGVDVIRTYPLASPGSAGTTSTDDNNDGADDTDLAAVATQIRPKIAGQSVTISPSALFVAGVTTDTTPAKFDPRVLLVAGDDVPLTFESIQTADGTAVTEAVTFEVRGVAPSVKVGETERTGGMTQIVFQYEAQGEDKVSYLGKYNPNSSRWETFQRGTHPRVLDLSPGQRDTWYAIDDTTDDLDDCVGTDISTYQAEHKIAGTGGSGFDSSAASCILLVIRDGGPYDEDNAVDGIVIDPVGFADAPFSDASSRRSGGGGGGAVSVLELGLLFFALAALLLMIRSRRAVRNTQ